MLDKNNILLPELSYLPESVFILQTTKKWDGEKPINAVMESNINFIGITGVKQTHSTIIHKIIQPNESLNGDGLWTKEKGIALYIKTADCVPLLFWDRDGNAVAAIHSGWRGTLGNIAGKTCRMFNDNNIASKDLYVWIGPSICGKCYSFGEDLLKNFQLSYPDFNFRQNIGCLDLPALITHQLIKTGVGEQNIFYSGYCTFEEDGLFYSYRRKSGLKNRQYSIIGKYL